jgi:hypothetical protein
MSLCGTTISGLCGSTATSILAQTGFLDKLPSEILSQCGILNGGMAAAIIYLVIQLAHNRKGWNADRAEMLKMMESQQKTYTTLAISQTKIETMLSVFKPT